MTKSFDELAKEQQESWDRLAEKHQREHEKFMSDFNEKMEKFDKNLESSRLIARETMSRIVVLSTTIIGFSVTLLSLKELNLRLDEHGLKLAWLLFTCTIALGLLLPYIESRAKYVIHWRGLQHQEWDKDSLNSLTFTDKIKISLAVVFSVLVVPRSLIFCRIYSDEAVKKKNALYNALTIHWTNKAIDSVLFLELVFIFTFVASLLVFLSSVRF